MLTSSKPMTAALTTMGLAASLSGSLVIHHRAPVAPVVAASARSVELTSFSSRLTADVHRGSLKARVATHHAVQVARRQPSGTPQQIAESLVADRGWDGSQWECLDELWTRESDWDVHAVNPTSGAYGIPQALPATKMAVAGSDYQNNPVTQIRWGLRYIANSYGTPCGALQQSDDRGYY